MLQFLAQTIPLTPTLFPLSKKKSIQFKNARIYAMDGDIVKTPDLMFLKIYAFNAHDVLCDARNQFGLEHSNHTFPRYTYTGGGASVGRSPFTSHMFSEAPKRDNMTMMVSANAGFTSVTSMVERL